MADTFFSREETIRVCARMGDAYERLPAAQRCGAPWIVACVTSHVWDMLDTSASPGKRALACGRANHSLGLGYGAIPGPDCRLHFCASLIAIAESYLREDLDQ